MIHIKITRYFNDFNALAYHFRVADIVEARELIETFYFHYAGVLEHRAGYLLFRAQDFEDIIELRTEDAEIQPIALNLPDSFGKVLVKFA